MNGIDVAKIIGGGVVLGLLAILWYDRDATKNGEAKTKLGATLYGVPFKAVQ